MDSLLFLATAIALYFLSDWILRRIEAARGRQFEHRELVFFAIILILTMSAFGLMRRLPI